MTIIRLAFALSSIAVAACSNEMYPPSSQPDAGGSQNDAGGAGSVTEIACSGATLAGQVKIADMAYMPKAISINDGDILQWVNDDTVEHTVTSGNPGDADAGSRFDSGALAPGDTFCLHFEGPAQYTYFCRFHSNQMRDATVTVH
jgi:plastocyanin